MADPTILQPFYADDLEMMGKAVRIAKLFKTLELKGPSIGYYPEPKKPLHICPKGEGGEAKKAFADAGLSVQTCRGHRYIGGYLGLDAMRALSLDPMVEKWVGGTKALAHVATMFP